MCPGNRFRYIKSWFVDFDPVIDNALAVGKPIPDELQARAEVRAALGDKRKPLPEAVQKQFPSSFVFSDEMGWIPEGWEVESLDEIAHYQNGLALQKFRPENEDDFLPVVKIAQLRKGFADGEEKASPTITPKCIIDDGDVVFSWSGSLLVDIWCGGRAALNQHLFKVTSATYPKWYFYNYTKHHLEEFQRIAADKAVTMGHIKREHLSQAKCVAPAGEILDACTSFVEPLLDRHVDLRKEDRWLETLRDTLLPKLLSGQLRIPDAEKRVTEVV
ncbi:Type I restriction modification DNA specificity domain-containing protein [Desulfuromonas thiophila]|uniref:Type I restriction modification DNA specificity domain-containing protein n=1 Tax=Desulfuromonas thiophila TaxID=57664 RepID=A0A1G7E8L4_9BACT|nr:Type I restriction modification DNA specificity domain-containing protein [Desulfuromonas thiophila]